MKIDLSNILEEKEKPKRKAVTFYLNKEVIDKVRIKYPTQSISRIVDFLLKAILEEDLK